ncbi:MAG: pyridoxal-phosphate dependent enzyme [Acidimicrobiales bacterium]
MNQSWLDTPPGAEWPDSTEPNPFIRYRRLLWSWHRAIESGWSDEDFVERVTSLDEVLASSGVGFTVTPTGWADALAGEGSVARVLAKDETHNVSGSHKARHLMGQLLHLAIDSESTDQRLAIASCGNAALGAATVAHAADRPLDVFIPTWADPFIVAMLEDLDASIHVCRRGEGEFGDPCMRRFLEAVAEGGVPFGVQATQNTWTLDGGRTIGWELADQLRHLDSSPGPGHLLVQVGGGALLVSCTIGLLEAVEKGRIATTPRIWAVQAEGCAPFDRAYTGVSTSGTIDDRLADAVARADELMFPWVEPSSAATGILDDITYDWLGVLRAVLATGGGSIVATEQEVLLANERAGDLFDADHTGTAGYAGVLAGVRQGVLDADQSVAVLMTGVRRQAEV